MTLRDQDYLGGKGVRLVCCQQAYWHWFEISNDVAASQNSARITLFSATRTLELQVRLLEIVKPHS